MPYGRPANRYSRAAFGEKRREHSLPKFDASGSNTTVVSQCCKVAALIADDGPIHKSVTQIHTEKRWLFAVSCTTVRFSAFSARCESQKSSQNSKTGSADDFPGFRHFSRLLETSTRTTMPKVSPQNRLWRKANRSGILSGICCSCVAERVKSGTLGPRECAVGHEPKWNQVLSVPAELACFLEGVVR